MYASTIEISDFGVLFIEGSTATRCFGFCSPVHCRNAHTKIKNAGSKKQLMSLGARTL
jgi:hypothetical protein